MPEIAKCPLCGQEPTLKYWDYDSDPSLYHCGATLESIVEWNRYAAAMELALSIAWKREVRETNCQESEFINAFEARIAALLHVREVFK